MLIGNNEIKMGLEPLYYRRRTHILRFVNECIANRVPRYLSNYFDIRNRVTFTVTKLEIIVTLI